MSFFFIMVAIVVETVKANENRIQENYAYNFKIFFIIK